MLLGMIYGPTASGKSALAIRLAKECGAEVISADSRQIYKGLVVGTGQVTEVEQEGVRHHALNFLDPKEPYSVGDFVQLVCDLEEKNPSTKYILCGGTGFYLKAIQQGMPEIPNVPREVEEMALQNFQSLGAKAFLESIADFDEINYKRLNVSDTQRLLRCYAVFMATGKPWSWWNAQPSLTPHWPHLKTIFLNPERAELHKKINLRVENMFKMGWVEEVHGLVRQGYNQTHPGLDAVGYREILQSFESKISMSELVFDIQAKTRQYAKRQISFRHQFENLVDFQSGMDLKTLF